jgi:hypothetical protein
VVVECGAVGVGVGELQGFIIHEMMPGITNENGVRRSTKSLVALAHQRREPGAGSDRAENERGLRSRGAGGASS